MKEIAEVTRDPASPAPPSPAEAPPLKQITRIRMLLVVHVMLGLLFGIWSAVEERRSVETMLLVPIIGLTLAQTSLLGFWVGFSPAKWWVRLAGLIVGIVYLGFLFGTGTRTDMLARLAVAIATGGIAAVFGLIRWWYADVRRFRQAAVQADQDGLKLSIRGLMLFTFVVAVTIVGVRELRESLPDGPNLFVVPVLGVSFIVVGLASVWAGLGLARPMLRSVVVLLLAAVLGALLVYTLYLDHWAMYLYFTTTMVLQAGVVIASLLVVRSCGYRLVRKTPSIAEPSA